MVLLRVLLIFLLFYLVLRFLGRVLFGFTRSQRSPSGGFGSHNNPQGKEGDVHVKYKPENQGKIIREDDGEYIKFEEIDDE